jgi:hypothetical protein
MPNAKRIQRSRRAGWRKPEGAVVVSRGTRWANPHDWRDLGHAEAVHRYRDDLIAGRLPIGVDEVRRDLAGRDLVCWCGPDQPRHADVLLELANENAPIEDHSIEAHEQYREETNRTAKRGPQHGFYHCR